MGCDDGVDIPGFWAAVGKGGVGKKTEFKYLVHEGRTYLQEMGEKDKEQNPIPASIYSKESVGKVT